MLLRKGQFFSALTFGIALFGCGSPGGLGAPCDTASDCESASAVCTESIISGTRFCTESCAGSLAGASCAGGEGRCMIDGEFAYCYLPCEGSGAVDSCEEVNSEMSHCETSPTTGDVSVCR